MSFDEAQARIALDSKDGCFLLPQEYILGLCDLTGELMRYAINQTHTDSTTATDVAAIIRFIERGTFLTYILVAQINEGS